MKSKTNSRENWKPVVGYEEFYEVSNLGRVRSISHRKCVHGVDTYSLRKTPLVMKLSKTQGGYIHVCLVREKQRHMEFVHRLVGLAFMEKPDGKDYINHLDYDITNNCVDNLEWCTQSENVAYSKEHRRRSRMCKTSTGEHHISFKKSKNRYRVSLPHGKEKTFKHLEEAIRFRDEAYKETEFAAA